MPTATMALFAQQAHQGSGQIQPSRFSPRAEQIDDDGHVAERTRESSDSRSSTSPVSAARSVVNGLKRVHGAILPLTSKDDM
jgi:hypothetical protein